MMNLNCYTLDEGPRFRCRNSFLADFSDGQKDFCCCCDVCCSVGAPDVSKRIVEASGCIKVDLSEPNLLFSQQVYEGVCVCVHVSVCEYVVFTRCGLVHID